MSDDENEINHIIASAARFGKSKIAGELFMDDLLKKTGVPPGERLKIISEMSEENEDRWIFADEDEYRCLTPQFGVASMAMTKVEDGHSGEKLRGNSEDLLCIAEDHLLGVNDSNIISSGESSVESMLKALGDFKDADGENVFIPRDWTCCVCKKELPCYREDGSILGVSFRRDQLGIEETKAYCHDCAEEERYLEDGSWLPDLAEMYISVRRCADIEDNLFYYNIPGNDMNLYLYARQNTYTEVCEKCQREAWFCDESVFNVDGCTCSINKGEEKQ